ncbi:MAG: S8 family serine peptidase, partial [Actinomycetota bacterium]|nr:S8 family serine peptidase [Actinomycetota bacterium]
SSVPRSGSDFYPTKSGYALGDGTSFSTPLVAGEAALLKAQSPAMTGPKLRAALIASAHGYRGLGLGAGQVDFALALRHATPTTHPTSAGVDGAQGVLRFTASSSASRVAFRIDSGAPLATAPVVHGTATLTWSSWGQRNGAHVLHAVDCSAFGECAGPSMSTSFALANDAPVLTSPTSGRTVTGRFDVTAAASGGGARLLVDGHAAGFAARSPYDFTVNATGLADTGHALAVQSCTSDGTRCEGPLSPVVPVTSRALHPTLIALSLSTISPNGDGRLDRATLTFSLLDPEVVAVQTIDPTGNVVRLSPLGALGRGRHAWTWRGTLGGGRVLPDGRYTIALATSRVVDGFTERGWVGHAGVVDTVAPTLSGVHGNQSPFFPVKDGYRDTFAPRVTVHGSGILALVVRTRSGHLVRTIVGRRSSGATALIWNGRDTSGRLVTAGTYRWTYSITDPAGNRTNARTYSVTVSAKRLRTRTRYVSIPAARPRHRGATAACAVASPSTSAWEGGVRLTNYCSADSGDFAYVPFEFTAPAAHAYKTIAIQAYGYSRHRPSELQAAFQRSDGALEIPHPVAVRSGRVGWVTVTTTGAAGRILTKHHVDVTLLLSSRYRGGNDFDMRSARLRITYVVVA